MVAKVEKGSYLFYAHLDLIPRRQDDLDPAGAILCDTSGHTFRERISKALSFPFRGLNQKGIDRLYFILWPEGKIDVPPRRGSGKTRFQREVLALDESQARAALRLGSGHQVIKGPPGSEWRWGRPEKTSIQIK